MQYYVIGADGSKYGPADIPTLKQWAAENRLTPDAILEDFGTGQRMAASQVAGIFEPGQGTAAAGGTLPTSQTTTQAQRDQGAQQLPSGSSGPSLYDSPVGNMPPGYYSRGNSADSGASDLTLAWVFAALGLFCCAIVFAPLGLWKANQAAAKGSMNAGAPKILCIIDLVLWVIFLAIRIPVILAVMRGGR